MKKMLLAFAALLILSPMVSTQALADSRGNLTISATFGNLDLHGPVVRHYPPQQIIVVNEPRYEKRERHGKRHHHRDRYDRGHNDCNTREDGRRQWRQETAVVYYYPEYRDSRGYRY